MPASLWNLSEYMHLFAPLKNKEKRIQIIWKCGIAELIWMVKNKCVEFYFFINYATSHQSTLKFDFSDCSLYFPIYLSIEWSKSQQNIYNNLSDKTYKNGSSVPL